jgi:hypothetical protein
MTPSFKTSKTSHLERPTSFSNDHRFSRNIVLPNGLKASVFEPNSPTKTRKKPIKTEACFEVLQIFTIVRIDINQQVIYLGYLPRHFHVLYRSGDFDSTRPKTHAYKYGFRDVVNNARFCIFHGVIYDRYTRQAKALKLAVKMAISPATATVIA